MVYCFSGTGNSAYIAKKISDKTGERFFDINAAVKSGGKDPVNDESDRLVFVTPTYAWRIPKVVDEWIRATDFGEKKRAWFVMDCGGEIGNAAKYNIKLCKAKNFTYMGTYQIVMPENYIAMFGVPEKEKALKIIEKAEPFIDCAGSAIADGAKFPLPRNNLYDRFMSGAVNGIFYRMFVKADSFTVGGGCKGCGLCVSVCPLNNIRLENNKPVWGKNCTHCMACICRCPYEAIEYGKKSIGKPRYTCEKTVK